MAAKEPTVEHRVRAVKLLESALYPIDAVRGVELIAQALAHAEAAAAEKAWDDGWEACRNHTHEGAFYTGNPYRLPAKGDGNV